MVAAIDGRIDFSTKLLRQQKVLEHHYAGQQSEPFASNPITINEAIDRYFPTRFYILAADNPMQVLAEHINWIGIKASKAARIREPKNLVVPTVGEFAGIYRDHSKAGKYNGLLVAFKRQTNSVFFRRNKTNLKGNREIIFLNPSTLTSSLTRVRVAELFHPNPSYSSSTNSGVSLTTIRQNLETGLYWLKVAENAVCKGIVTRDFYPSVKKAPRRPRSSNGQHDLIPSTQLG